MKKIATQLALVACAILLAESASAQTDTTGRPVPDTVGRPVPDDSTRMPKNKKRNKKDRKMPKDSLNRAMHTNSPVAMLNNQWNKSLPVMYAVTDRLLTTTKEFYLKKQEPTEA